MIALKLVTHSLSMVWRNRLDAIRVASPLIATTLITQLYLFFALGVNPLLGEDVDFTAAGGAGAVLFVLYALGAIAGVWTYVAWHRFVLLADYPRGVCLPIPVARGLAYFGISLLVTLIAALIGAVLGVGFGFVGGAIDGILSNEVGVMTALGVTLAALVVIPLSLRLAVMLPAAAVGEKLGLKAAWAATRGAGATLLGAAILLTLAILAVVVPVGAIAFALPAPINILLALPFSMFATLVGVSFLTTLYGYYIEKRDLS